MKIYPDTGASGNVDGASQRQPTHMRSAPGLMAAEGDGRAKAEGNRGKEQAAQSRDEATWLLRRERNQWLPEDQEDLDTWMREYMASDLGQESSGECAVQPVRRAQSAGSGGSDCRRRADSTHRRLETQGQCSRKCRPDAQHTAWHPLRRAPHCSLGRMVRQFDHCAQPAEGPGNLGVRQFDPSGLLSATVKSPPDKREVRSFSRPGILTRRTGRTARCKPPFGGQEDN